MKNLKNEFLEHIEKNNVDIKCVALELKKYDKKKANYNLPPNYSEKDLESFLNKIDFEYDHNYGDHQIHGFVWYLDGTFSRRSEYDGAEWFEYIKTPEIPVKLVLQGEKNLLKTIIQPNISDAVNKKRI